jgi:dolichol-phosphate mannosyltransferase
MSSKKSIDIITSAYNEEDCLEELIDRIHGVMRNEPDYFFKFIIIDNGSVDSTWRIISKAASQNDNFIGIRMSRNFTFDSALTCGLDHATSDAAVIMASDLQDPPEVIHNFLREYEKGYDQVVAKIVSRKTVPLFRRVSTSLFYKIAFKMSSNLLPQYVSDFRLLSRKTYIAVNSLREKHRYLRGITAWVGFKTCSIDIERPPRFSGESKWLNMSISKVITNATKSILSFSSIPLTWISTVGILLSFFSFITLILLVIFWLISGVPFAGFASLISVGILSFSILMLFLGIFSQYLGLIYEEVKNRPIYIVAERINHEQ